LYSKYAILYSSTQLKMKMHTQKIFNTKILLNCDYIISCWNVVVRFSDAEAAAFPIAYASDLRTNVIKQKVNKIFKIIFCK